MSPPPDPVSAPSPVPPADLAPAPVVAPPPAVASSSAPAVVTAPAPEVAHLGARGVASAPAPAAATAPVPAAASAPAPAAAPALAQPPAPAAAASYAAAVAASVLLPVILSVYLTFTAFIAKPEDLEIRLGACLTLFLALVAIQFVIDSQLPRTSAITNFGYLMIVSYIVIWLCTMETLIAFCIAERIEKNVQELVQDTLPPALSFKRPAGDRAAGEKLMGGGEDADGADSNDPEAIAEAAAERRAAAAEEKQKNVVPGLLLVPLLLLSLSVLRIHARHGPEIAAADAQPHSRSGIPAAGGVADSHGGQFESQSPEVGASGGRQQGPSAASGGRRVANTGSNDGAAESIAEWKRRSAEAGAHFFPLQRAEDARSRDELHRRILASMGQGMKPPEASGTVSQEKGYRLPLLNYESALVSTANGTMGNTMVNYSTFLNDNQIRLPYVPPCHAPLSARHSLPCRPLAAGHSLPATRCPPLAARHSLPATRCRPLAARHSLPATRCPPLAARHSLPATRCPPLSLTLSKRTLTPPSLSNSQAPLSRSTIIPGPSPSQQTLPTFLLPSFSAFSPHPRSLLPPSCHRVYPYYVNLKLGSQKQQFSMALNVLIQDTFVPCDCLHCGSMRKGTTTSKPFSTLASTTLKYISCSDQRCMTGVDSGYYGCNTDGLGNYINTTGLLPGDDALCVYSASASGYDYYEADFDTGSYLQSVGHVVEDTVYLTAPDGTEVNRSIVFGCGVNQQGYWGMQGWQYGSWAAGGVLGLGWGSPFLWQLTGINDPSAFAVCLEEPTPTNKTGWDGELPLQTGSSHLTIGATGLPAGASYSHIQMTISNATHTLNITDDPADVPADFPQDTTPGFYFMPESFVHLLRYPLLIDLLDKLADMTGQDLTFYGYDKDMYRLVCFTNKNKAVDPFTAFPTIDISFLSADNTSATSHFYLKPREYLAQIAPLTYCVMATYLPADRNYYSLIGEPALFNKYLFLDYTNEIAGWMDAPNCGAEPLLPPPSPPPPSPVFKGDTHSSPVAAALSSAIVLATSAALLALSLH
ncbi:unnamed protein product [Closterium sp. NIES-65]|nr:unnamed protein product [Closterium sp. NIES-65]